MFRKYFNDHWKKNPLYNNAAQALEILYCFERLPQLVDELLEIDNTPEIVSYQTQEGQGTGLVEAPRGLLIHHYRVEQGLVKGADIITPTAQNAEDIERYGMIAAQTLLDRGEEEKIRDRLDIIVRAYDPCISCSVHLAEVKTVEETAWENQLAVCSSELDTQNIKSLVNSDQPFIFVDALDAGKKPGAISLIPLLAVLYSSSLSHRLAPFIQNEFSYSQLKKSYLLGIQPRSITKQQHLSPEVSQALQRLIDQLEN